MRRETHQWYSQSLGREMGRLLYGEGPWPVVDADGDLLAVYERHRGDTVKPAVVVAG